MWITVANRYGKWIVRGFRREIKISYTSGELPWKSDNEWRVKVAPVRRWINPNVTRNQIRPQSTFISKSTKYLAQASHHRKLCPGKHQISFTEKDLTRSKVEAGWDDNYEILSKWIIEIQRQSNHQQMSWFLSLFITERSWILTWGTVWCCCSIDYSSQEIEEL